MPIKVNASLNEDNTMFKTIDSFVHSTMTWLLPKVNFVDPIDHWVVFTGMVLAGLGTWLLCNVMEKRNPGNL